MKKSTVGSIAAFAVIATGVIWGSVAWRDAREAAPEPTAVVQVQPRGFVSEPTVTPTPTPEPVVEVAPEPVQEPVSEEPVYGQYPSGWAVPIIPSPDPVNAPDGWRYDTGACASQSASTGADGNAYCD